MGRFVGFMIVQDGGPTFSRSKGGCARSDRRMRNGLPRRSGRARAHDTSWSRRDGLRGLDGRRTPGAGRLSRRGIAFCSPVVSGGCLPTAPFSASRSRRFAPFRPRWARSLSVPFAPSRGTGGAPSGLTPVAVAHHAVTRKPPGTRDRICESARPRPGPPGAGLGNEASVPADRFVRSWRSPVQALCATPADREAGYGRHTPIAVRRRVVIPDTGCAGSG
jgi:hypothetical protein